MRQYRVVNAAITVLILATVGLLYIVTIPGVHFRLRETGMAIMPDWTFWLWISLWTFIWMGALAATVKVYRRPQKALMPVRVWTGPLMLAGATWGALAGMVVFSAGYFLCCVSLLPPKLSDVAMLSACGVLFAGIFMYHAFKQELSLYDRVGSLCCGGEDQSPCPTR